MSGNVADMTPRQTRIGSPAARRPGIIPERRDTRAPALEGFARMSSASRGDGGAEELRRTLGLVTDAAGSFQAYAERAHQQQENINSGKGAADQATGNVDPDLAERSTAYRRAVELGREQTGFPSAVEAYGQELVGIIEHQTSADLSARRGEADQHIDEFLRGYAVDPETGKLRDSLTTPEAQRWLGEEMGRTRQRLTAAAHARIDERFKGESLTNMGDLLGAQLDRGEIDVAALRNVLPPIVTDDEIRGTILTTFQSKAEQLKDKGRYVESRRILDQLLGDVATAAAPAPAPGSSIAARPPVSPTVARKRSQGEVIGFVLNTLEGGSTVVDNGDGGGTTKFGITQRYNPGVDIANLTFAQASKIAKDRYWQPIYDEAHPAVAAIAFDAGFINSKAFGRELATKYANDPTGALNAYRKRLQDIATKPDKARFLKGWMNRVDRLGGYLGVAPGGSGTDTVISDPTFALSPEPLDPVEEARASPGASFTPLLAGGLALRPEERTRVMQYRDQLSREIKQEWTRERRDKQDEAHAGFMLRLSGLGAPTTPAEISAATRDGTIRPEDAVQLLNVVRVDAERDEQRAERASALAERERERAEEQQAQGMVARLMGPVYSGQRTPGEALRMFSQGAATIDPKVRRAVLGALTAEANGIEEVRKNNPALRSATDALDDGEAEMLRLVRRPYRDPKSGRVVTAEQQRAIISLEFAKAKRTLFQTAIDKGDIGNLREGLIAGIKGKIRPYVINREAQRR